MKLPVPCNPQYLALTQLKEKLFFGLAQMQIGKKHLPVMKVNTSLISLHGIGYEQSN
jgi:hypothetical protein